MSETTESCPCGSEKSFSACCEPFLKGNAIPPTAEATMRSRYTAHVKGEIEYLMQTLHPKTRNTFERDSVADFAKKSEWMSLEILNTEKGGPEDLTGVVEFKATYRNKRGKQIHHEISDFEKVGEKWYFKDGHYPKVQPIKAKVKVGRNDPCPCGSGKKYKKCCGA